MSKKRLGKLRHSAAVIMPLLALWVGREYPYIHGPPNYEEMLVDPQVLRDNQWSHNVALLKEAQRTGCKVALAAMSFCAQVRRVLEIL